MDEVTLCRAEWDIIMGRLDRLVQQAHELNDQLDGLLGDLEAVEKGLEVS